MKTKIKILYASVLLAIGGSASAATEWVLTTGTVGGGVTVSSSAWADTGSGSPRLLEQQTAPANFQLYSGGLGINNLDGCSTAVVGCTTANGYDPGDMASTAPEHAIDNNDRNEMVLISFSQKVKLTNVKFGWIGSDSDYTVMAYTANDTPTLGEKTWGTLGSGWANIGNYSDAVLNANSSINAGNVYSSYWLIGAYNATANPTGGSVTGTGFDYVKLYSVTGDVGVPEPGSLALSGLALLGTLTLRGRRRA